MIPSHPGTCAFELEGRLLPAGGAASRAVTPVPTVTNQRLGRGRWAQKWDARLNSVGVA